MKKNQFISNSKIIAMGLFLGFFCFSCLGKSTQLSVYKDPCEALKICSCKDLFSKDKTTCEENVGKLSAEQCQETYEKSCMAPFPVNKAATDTFMVGGVSIAKPKIPGGWLQGNCAKALACCLTIQVTKDRLKCNEEIQKIYNGNTVEDAEKKCAEEAPKYAGMSCNPADISSGGGGKTTTPAPTP